MKIQKDIDSLPIFYRTSSMPPKLWKAIKMYASENQCNVNNAIHAAIDTEFQVLIEKLKQLGFPKIGRQEKLVRIPLDDNILGWINYGRRETGLPSILLLKLCLDQFVENYMIKSTLKQDKSNE